MPMSFCFTFFHICLLETLRRKYCEWKRRQGAFAFVCARKKYASMCLCVGLCARCALPSPMQTIKLMSSRRTTRPALYRAAWIVVIRGLSGGSLLPVSEEQKAEYKQSLLLCQHTEDFPLILSFPTLSFLMLGRCWIGYTYERNCDFPHQFLKVAASEAITPIAKGRNIWNNIFFFFCSWTAPSLNHGDPAADQIVRGSSGGCRGDLISTPDSRYYRVFYKSFLWGNLRFGGCLEKPRLQAWFWCKKLCSRYKIGKVTKRKRSVKPTCANGGTNRGTNASFCTSGVFIFFGAWPNLFWVRQCDGETWKKRKERRRRKTVATGKEKRLL